MGERRARSRGRVLRWSVLLVACAIVAWEGVHALRVYRFERSSYLPNPHPVATPPDARELGLRDVTFTSSFGARLRGWYVPPRGGTPAGDAVIVLTHGSLGDRTNRLDDARALVRRGYGVLLFDWPGQGESSGMVSWGPQERAALESAIDFVLRDRGGDSTRVGVVGFSDGGYIAAQVAAEDPRVRALVVESSPSDFEKLTRVQYRRGGPVIQAAALLALRRFGPDPKDRRSVDVIGRIAPRPVLVVGGLADRVVPVDEAREIYAAARDPKELLLIPGAGHGDYQRVWGARFDSALVRFFDRRLASGDVARADTGR